MQLQPVPKRCPKCQGTMKVEPQRLACIHCGKSIYVPAGDDEG
jgi:Zn finger protein HypA/HybF involved in hydrogenase expression